MRCVQKKEKKWKREYYNGDLAGGSKFRYGNSSLFRYIMIRNIKLILGLPKVICK